MFPVDEVSVEIQEICIIHISDSLLVRHILKVCQQQVTTSLKLHVSSLFDINAQLGGHFFAVFDLLFQIVSNIIWIRYL